MPHINNDDENFVIFYLVNDSITARASRVEPFEFVIQWFSHSPRIFAQGSIKISNHRVRNLLRKLVRNRPLRCRSQLNVISRQLNGIPFYLFTQQALLEFSSHLFQRIQFDVWVIFELKNACMELWIRHDFHRFNHGFILLEVQNDYCWFAVLGDNYFFFTSC